MSKTAKVRMVKGPAIVNVAGTCHVLGSDVSDKTINIRSGKALPFEPLRQCKLRVRFGRGGKMWLAEPWAAGISIWRDIANQVSVLSGSKKATVMLTGDADTGKSSLSAYLANVALAEGLVPCVIDGDIGQGDLAPPACMGAAILSNQVVDLRDVNSDMFEFVGNTSPAGFERLVSKRLRSILKRVSPLGDIYIVNTDGYVRKGGVQYKLSIAEELQPDIIVCLGQNRKLKDAFRDGPWQVLHARSSNQASKSRYERTSRRLDQFFRHIGNGSSLVELTHVKFVYFDKMFCLSGLSRPPIIQLDPHNLDRMFVGLGSNTQVTGFGIITDIDQNRITVQTDVGFFDTIYLSNIRLSRDKAVEIRIA